MNINMPKFWDKVTKVASITSIISVCAYFNDRQTENALKIKWEFIKAKEIELEKKAAEIQNKEQTLTEIESNLSSLLNNAKREINEAVSKIENSWTSINKTSKDLVSQSQLNTTTLEKKMELWSKGKSDILAEIEKIQANKNKCSLKMGDILKALDDAKKAASSGNGNNYIGSNYLEWIQNYIQGFMDSWNGFVHQLTIEQYVSVVHIITSITLLTCLFNIIIIIYSDFLINYFKIEEKYPKFGRLIKLRRKFQHLSLLWNIIFIVFISCSIIYINLQILSL